MFLASADEATTGDIAAGPYLSEGTVRNYLSTAIKKLGERTGLLQAESGTAARRQSPH